MLLNVLDYPTVKAALEAAEDGDRVYFPGVQPYVAPVDGWTITKSLELFGDGAGEGGTTLFPSAGSNEAMFLLDPGTSSGPTDHPTLSHVYFHDLRFVSQQPGVRQGKQGIRFKTNSGGKLAEFRVERVYMGWLGEAGIELLGSAAEHGAIVGFLVADSEFVSCGKQGIDLAVAWMVQCVRTRFVANLHHGLRTRGTEIALYGCAFTNNCDGGGDAQLSAYDDNIEPSQLEMFRLDSCSFKRSTGIRQVPACRLRQFDGAVCIGGNYFEEPSGSTNGVGVQFAATALTVRGAAIVLPNRFINIATAISVSSAAALQGFILFPQLCEPSSTVIELPQFADDAPVAIPAANAAAGNAAGGLALPAFDIDPNSNLQFGMLAYNKSSDPAAGKHLRVVRANATTGVPEWTNVTTE